MAENLIVRKKMKNEKEQFLAHHLLLQYMYAENDAVMEQLEEISEEYGWNQWCCVVLIETDQDFFDSLHGGLEEEISIDLRRNFYYLNLNSRQSLLFFSDVNCDYQLVAKQISFILRRKYSIRFYLSISKRFEGIKALPEVLNQLEQRMEEKYYYKENRVFFSEEDELNSVGKEVQDSQLMQLISEDISRKDTERLWKHFNYLKSKYQDSTSFSAMYVKFVFSNVVQEIFQEEHFADDGRLEKEIDFLYACNSITQIIKITEDIIKEYELFINNSLKKAWVEIRRARKFIEENCEKDFTIEMTAQEVQMPCGYFSFLFRKETGMSIDRYLHVQRMKKSKRLLAFDCWESVSHRVGFKNPQYFYKCFIEFYGYAPDK